MNWLVYMVAVLVALAFDASLGGVFEFGSAHPQILPAVVVFALLSVPRRIALRAAMLAGLLADLLAPMVGEDGSLVAVPGPRVLAYALGALAVLQLRGLLYRRNPLSAAVTTFSFSMLAAVAFVALWTLRGGMLGAGAPWWPSTGASEMWARFLGAIAEGLLAIPVLWILERTRPAWDFALVTRLAVGAARERV